MISRRDLLISAAGVAVAGKAGAGTIFPNSVVMPEDFSPTGSVTKDMDAISKAIKHLNGHGGGTLKLRAGQTYLLSNMGGAKGVRITAPLRIDLNGATIQRPDGVMRAPHHRLAHLHLARDGVSLSIENGSIDANYTNNRKPEGLSPFAWEQNTSVLITVRKGVRARTVSLTDLTLKDREVFDHLRIFVGRGGALELLRFANLRSFTEWDGVNGRADIIWYRGVQRVVGRDCAYLHAIETEFTEPEDVDSTVVLSDLHVGRLDLAYYHSDNRNSTHLIRVRADRITSLLGGKFYVRDCSLGFGGLGNYIRPPFIHATETTWLLSREGWDFIAPKTAELRAKFLRCTFRRNPAQRPPERDTIAIRMPVVAPWNKLVREITFEDCLFDVSDFARVANPSGTTNWINNVYRYSGDWALHFVGGIRIQRATVINRARSFEGALEEGRQIAKCSLLLHNMDQLRGDEFVRVGGSWVGGEPTVRFRGSAETSRLVSERTIFSKTKPQAAIAGDLLRLIPPPLDGPAIYIARRSSNSSPQWQ